MPRAGKNQFDKCKTKIWAPFYIRKLAANTVIMGRKVRRRDEDHMPKSCQGVVGKVALAHRGTSGCPHGYQYLERPRSTENFRKCRHDILAEKCRNPACTEAYAEQKDAGIYPCSSSSGRTGDM